MSDIYSVMARSGTNRDDVAKCGVAPIGDYCCKESIKSQGKICRSCPYNPISSVVTVQTENHPSYIGDGSREFRRRIW